MGYGLTLVHPVTRETLELDTPHQMRGSTYAIGGDTRLSLSVTYNYANRYYPLIPETEDARGSLWALHGMSAVDSIPILERAISLLGDDVSDDYWEATEGNAKVALVQLLTMAKLRPDGVWEVD
jgi:hypothetical protein